MLDCRILGFLCEFEMFSHVNSRQRSFERIDTCTVALLLSGTSLSEYWLAADAHVQTQFFRHIGNPLMPFVLFISP